MCHFKKAETYVSEAFSLRRLNNTLTYEEIMMILIDLERDRKMYSRTQTVASSEGIFQNLNSNSLPTSIAGSVSIGPYCGIHEYGPSTGLTTYVKTLDD